MESIIVSSSNEFKEILIIVIIHFVVALIAMLELKFIPFYTTLEKIVWFIIIWALPFVGVIYFHQYAKTGWKKIHL